MKRIILLLTLIFMATTLKSEVLPQPQHNDSGMSLEQALRLRHTTREFDSTRNLTMQQLSDLLWAAQGVNRPEEGKLTSPTAINKQEVAIYVFSRDDVRLYDPHKNTLDKIADGDHRALASRRGDFVQEFVLDAPVILVMVADIAKFEMPIQPSMVMGAVDVGIVSQNINLFCAANGLATVPRACMDAAAISQLLNLTPMQVPVLNNPVGYAR